MVLGFTARCWNWPVYGSCRSSIAGFVTILYEWWLLVIEITQPSQRSFWFASRVDFFPTNQILVLHSLFRCYFPHQLLPSHQMSLVHESFQASHQCWSGLTCHIAMNTIDVCQKVWSPWSDISDLPVSAMRMITFIWQLASRRLWRLHAVARKICLSQGFTIQSQSIVRWSRHSQAG